MYVVYYTKNKALNILRLSQHKTAPIIYLMLFEKSFTKRLIISSQDTFTIVLVDSMSKKQGRANLREQKRAFNGKSKGKTKEKGKGKWSEPAYDAADEQDLIRRLDEAGLRVSYVEGDGNCLFRAIAFQLWEDEKLWYRVRAEVVEYIKIHRDHFEYFVEDDEPFEDYVTRMGSPAEWGGNQEVFAAAQLYGIDVSIYQAGTPKLQMRVERREKDIAKEIYLSYHGGCHYNAVVSAESQVGSSIQKLRGCETEVEAVGQAVLTNSHSGHIDECAAKIVKMSISKKVGIESVKFCLVELC